MRSVAFRKHEFFNFNQIQSKFYVLDPWLDNDVRSFLTNVYFFLGSPNRLADDFLATQTDGYTAHLHLQVCEMNVMDSMSGTTLLTWMKRDEGGKRMVAEPAAYLTMALWGGTPIWVRRLLGPNKIYPPFLVILNFFFMENQE